MFMDEVVMFMGDNDKAELASTGIACLRNVVQSGRWGLLTDIDGTLASIAPSPAEAFVDAVIQRLLGQLARRLPLVAALTGRPAVEARAMVAVERVVYVGNHGFERYVAGELRIHPEALAWQPKIARLLESMAVDLAEVEGLSYENKGVTASVHYRRAPDPVAARSRILAHIAASVYARGLSVTEGKMVIEIRPPLAVNKGTAALSLIEEYELEGALYIGDDLTDLDAFRVLRSWREARKGTACIVAVAGEEAPPILLVNADLVLDGVAGVRRLLEWLSQRPA